MANVDREFVERLDVFTESLGDVVKLLKSKVDKKETDVTNGMLKNMPDRLTEIAEDLKTVKDNVGDIKTTTDDIKKSVDEIKSQKESGGLLGGKDGGNKEKIKDGVSTIVLMAGGILALGAAFKIVGDVNFASVIALSTSMITLAYAFSKIYETTKDNDIGYKDVIFVSSILPIMSVGLALSSYILSKSSEINLEKSLSIVFTAGALGTSLFLMSKSLNKFKSRDTAKYLLLPVILPAIAAGIFLSSLLLSKTPTIGLGQALSIIIVSGALGVSLFLMSKSLNKFKSRDTAKYLLLPVILPAIAAGIFLSSLLLSKTPTIGLGQALSIIIVSGALGVSLFLMSKALSSMGKKSKIKDFLLLPIILPAIAAGIFLSSWILKGTADMSLREAINIGLASLAIGIGSLAMIPILVAVGKFKLRSDDILRAGLAVTMISAVIVASAFILQGGSDLIGGFDPDKVPDYEWSLKVGLNIIAFGAVVVGLGFIVKTLGPANLAIGAISVLGISALLVASAFILQEGSNLFGGFDIDKVPSYDWSLRVGTSLLVFGGAATALGAIIMSGIGAAALLAGSAAILAMPVLMGATAAIFKETSNVIGGFNEDDLPSLEWSERIGKSLMYFGAAMLVSAPGAIISGVFSLFGGDPPLIKVAKQMKEVAKVLNDNDIDWKNVGYPTEEWAKGVGTSMSKFAEMQLMMDGGDRLNKIVSWITGDDSKSKAIEGIAKQMINIAGVMNDPIWGTDIKYPKPEWAKGVGDSLFSFANTFKILDNNVDNIDNDKLEFLSLIFQFMDLFQGQDWSNLPDTSNIKTWSDGVVKGISSFIGLLETIDNSSYKRDDRKGLEYLVSTMVIISKGTKDIDFNSNIPEEWGKNIKKGIIPIIDILQTIDESPYIRDDSNGIGYIVSTMKIIYNGTKDIDFNSNIPEEWGGNIKKGIIPIINILETIDKSSYGRGDRKGLEYLVDTMNYISEKINKSEYKNMNDWGESISSFALSISKIPNDLYNKASQLSSSLNKLTEIETEDTIRNLAESIKYLSESLDGLNTGTIDKLNGLANSTLVMSLVDTVKLEEFINTVDEKKGDLSDIMSIGNMMAPQQQEVGQSPTIVYNKKGDNKPTDEEKENFESLMKQLKTMTDYLSSMLNVKYMNSPSVLDYQSTHKNKNVVD